MKKQTIVGWDIKGLYSEDEEGVRTPFEIDRTETEPKVFNYALVNKQIRFLQGEILTIIDASITGNQGESIKSLIRDKVNHKLSWLYELAGLPEELSKDY